MSENGPKGGGAKPVDFSELKRWLIGDAEPREVVRVLAREAGVAARKWVDGKFAAMLDESEPKAKTRAQVPRMEGDDHE